MPGLCDVAQALARDENFWLAESLGSRKKA
jgi:hypothetical protein